jgi:hypothetical protein
LFLHCNAGKSSQHAEEIPVQELIAAIDKAHAENWDECYIEIIAKPAKKSVTPQKSEETE